MSKSKLTAEQELQLVEKRQNASLDVLAADFGVSKTSVRNILKRHGVIETNEKFSGKRALSDDEETAIVRRYTEGETVYAIWQSTYKHLNVMTLHNALKRRGVQTRPELVRHKLTDDQKKLVVEACREGLPASRAADKFGVSEATVTRILRAYREGGGVLEMPHGSPRTYQVNEEAFDVLTPEALYWMGFLWADGHLSKGHALICELAARDREHLVKLRAFLKSEHAIYPNEGKTAFGGPFYRYSVKSKKLGLSLIGHGYGPKKVRVPVSYDVGMSTDFWRGVMDGDGSIGTTNGYVCFSLCGHRPMVDLFQKFLEIKCDLRLEVIPASSCIFQVETSGSTAANVVRTLYEGAAVGLDRKLARASDILSGNLATSYDEGPSTTLDSELDSTLVVG